jgi:hypothetical protein
MSLFSIFSGKRAASGPIAPLPPDIEPRPFKLACRRLLEQHGWVILAEGHSHQLNIRRDKLSARIFTAGPGEEFTGMLRHDLFEARAESPFPLVLVTYDKSALAIRRLLAESAFTVCDYTELDRFERFCQNSAPEAVSRLEEGFHGAVDNFAPPATLGGWVRLRRNGRLLPVPAVIAFRQGQEIARTRPHYPRPDICDDPAYPAGFKLACGALCSERDLAADLIEVKAEDANGLLYPVRMWGKLTGEMRLRLAMRDDPGFAGTDIARLVTKTGQD